MDLPAGVTALGEWLGQNGEIVPDPTLFNEAAVFAAERERIFARPWMAADHVTRLAEDGRYFRFDADSRSIVVTRDSDGRLHALRNVCIHAGYPVCDAEEGAAERLMCPYHGWEYALDGRLVEPNLSSRIDPSRLRMTSYRVCVRDGLLFIAPSASPPSDESIAGPLPVWLAEGRVTKRQCHNTTWNWKFMLNFLGSRPHLFFAGPTDVDAHASCFEFGPLSRIIVNSERAVLVRVIPKFAERTDLQVIEITSGDAPAEAASPAAGDTVADALRRAGVPSSAELDRKFFSWYWSLMSEA
ncbi:MAG TPA: Rieske (2Fe-2S) protein [Stellaceae bacterium]|nr:Rieske (2Fe-2S) protein [Stellaceae bacterium]